VQLERFRDDDGRRVRLTESERDRLLSVYGNDAEKQIALSLMARCGCRSHEAASVRPMDVIEGDETGRWFLRIPEGKGTKERQTPMPLDLAGMIRGRDGAPGQPVVEVTTRTLRRWVERAAQKRAAEEGDDRWLHLSTHDLRRTWGHLTLEAGVQPSVLMQWGGWEDYQTFKNHYLGKHSEETQAREAEKVAWL
jgi:integrase